MIGTGAAGNNIPAMTIVHPPPISTSNSRSVAVAVPAMAMTKMADTADWLRNSAPCSKKPTPRTSAATSAISVATPIATAPDRPELLPATALTAVPMPIPSATPAISCSARWARSVLVADSDKAADTGAKNGW